MSTDLRNMPEEMPVLHKRALLFMDMEHGGYRQEWECVEYPQIRLSVAALTSETKPQKFYFVEGLSVQFESIREAYTALRNKTALLVSQKDG